jgi:hypothetical protein
MKSILLLLALCGLSSSALSDEPHSGLSIEVLSFSTEIGDLSFRVINKSDTAYLVEISSLVGAGFSLEGPGHAYISFGPDWIHEESEKTYFILRSRASGNAKESRSRVFRAKFSYIEDLDKADKDRWRDGNIEIRFLVSGFLWPKTKAFSETLDVRLPFVDLDRGRPLVPSGENGTNKKANKSPLPTGNGPTNSTTTTKP